VKPLFNCFGHIHEAYGVEKIDDTTYINASTCNLKYGPFNAPIVFDIDIETK
jgi:Icc-related predicted phosphoesterase